MENALSVRRLGRHTSGGSGPLRLRRVLGRTDGSVRLASAPGPFTVLAQNMALLPRVPGLYKGTNRSGAIGQIVGEIGALRPTVVGLCETWVQSERDEIREALASWYPHAVEGPDRSGSSVLGLPKVSDGGLLLLSSVPVETTGSMVYRSCDRQDCAAAKGILHMRTAVADVFYSHTQDISTADGPEALNRQLDEMEAFVESRRDPARSAVIMGDLNVPGEQAGYYQQLVTRLGNPVDCWTVLGNAPDTGLTEFVDSTFYDDPDDRPDRSERLDYVLLKPGTGSVPLVASTDVLRFEHDGHAISDHDAITARFEPVATIT